MLDLRANTQVIVPIGPFVDKDDGLTPETGITLGAADEAELLKHGSTTVVDISGATWAAITGMDGYFALTLTTSHVDTEGQLTVVVQDDSVCLPVRCSFRVLSEAAYDSLYAAKDDGYMDVNIKTIGRSDTQETEADNLESACSNYSATRGLAGTALPAAAADAAGGLPISDAGGLDLDNFVQDAIEANHLDHLFAAAYDASSKPGDSTAFLNRAVEHASGGNPRMTTVFVGNVQGQCNAALSAYDPPTRTEATADKNEILDTIGTPSDLGNGDDIATNLADMAGATFASSTDSLESLRDRGDAAWITGAAAIADAVWEEAIGDHSGTSGSTAEALNAAGGSGDPWTTTLPGSYTGSQAGKILADVLDDVTGLDGDAMRGTDSAYTGTPPTAAAIRSEIDSNSTQLAVIVEDTGTTLPASIAGLNDLSTADIDARLAAYDAPTKAELDAGFAALNDPTAAAIADAVWEEAIGDHSGTSGSTAEALDDASSGGGASAADIADAVWDEAAAAHTTAGSMGAAMSAAGSAGDPWITALPGAYSAGTAGYLVGTWLPQIETLATSLAGTAVTIVSRVSGGTITAYIGDDYKVRSGTQLSIPVDDPGGALASKLNGYGVANLAFGASASHHAAGQITGTISSVTADGDGTTTIAVEITACGSGLRPGEYTYQIQSTQTQGTEYDDYVELEGVLVLTRRTVSPVG